MKIKINGDYEFTKIEYKKRKARLNRIWIEEHEHLNSFNYWYYRYFTNDFEKFLVNVITEK